VDGWVVHRTKNLLTQELYTPTLGVVRCSKNRGMRQATTLGRVQEQIGPKPAAAGCLFEELDRMDLNRKDDHVQRN